MNWNPYLVSILIYLFALVAVGIYKSRSVKNSADFMVAGRRLGWPVLVGTMLATWMGNGSLFGGAGLAYRNGLSSLWQNAGAWLGIVMIYCIARRIRNFGHMTVPDIFEKRYNRSAGILATVITAIAYLTIVSYQFKGGGRVLNIITEGTISIETGIVITALFAISYTVLAGMVSVVYTDVINGVIMIVGLIGGLVYMLYTVGGVGEVAAYAQSADKASLFGQWAQEGSQTGTAPVIAISFLIPTMLLLLGDSNIYQRIFSARDSGSAQKAVLCLVFGVVLLEGAIAAYGLVGATAASKKLIPDLAAQGLSENVIPTIAMEVLPLGLGMIMMATMMAIIVSTADSFLLVPATNLTRDIYQQLFCPKAPEQRLVWIGRGLVLVLGIIAYLLVHQFPSILSAAYTAYLIYGAAITPALLAAFLWKRATAYGAVASIVSGGGVTLIWSFYLSKQPYFKTWSPFLQEVTYPAVGISVIALIGISLLTKKPTEGEWQPFFNDQ